MTKLIFHKT